MSKELWIERHEEIGEDYEAGYLTRDEALSELLSLGIDLIDAMDELDAIDNPHGLPCY